MKYVLILILIVGLKGCGDDASGPSKDYPIFHNDKTQDLAIKINQIRRVRGFSEFIYLQNVDYLLDGEKKNFRNEIINYSNEQIYNNDGGIIYDDSTKTIAIVKEIVFLENLNAIVDSISNYEHFWYNDFKNSKVKLSFVIVEVENNSPKEDVFGEFNSLYGLHQFYVFIYYETDNK